MTWAELVMHNLELVLAVGLFLVGWYFGTRAERTHLASLADDEQQYSYIKVSGERFFEPNCQAKTDAVLVVGSVVIAQDRFKLVVASLLSLLGKNLTVYESLLERARREAVVRAKYQAQYYQCNAIYGLRFEMTEVDGGGVEVLAYGTAVYESDKLAMR